MNGSKIESDRGLSIIEGETIVGATSSDFLLVCISPLPSKKKLASSV